MEYLFIYLLQLADAITAIQFASIVATIFSGVGSLITYFTISTDCGDDVEEQETLLNKIFVPFKKMFIISTVIMVLIGLIPTKNTLLLMGGTYLGKKAINAVVTDTKIQKVNTIIELELDKRIKELQTTEAKQRGNTNE